MSPTLQRYGLILSLFWAASASAAGVDALFAMSMPDTEGRTVTFSQYRGKPLLLHFWASWCAPCQDNGPDLAALQAAYGMYGLQALSIAVEHDRAVVGDVLKHCKPGVPMVYDKKKSIWLLQSLGHVSAELPFTLLVDGQGGVRFRQQGRFLRSDIDAVMKSLPH